MERGVDWQPKRRSVEVLFFVVCVLFVSVTHVSLVCTNYMIYAHILVEHLIAGMNVVQTDADMTSGQP